MGILNVTPDSFSDGGRFTTVEGALRRAEAMADEGAAIVDVGGESTRPRGTAYGAGAEPVGAEEEMRRVVPVVEAIVRELPHLLVSVDTYKGEVARAALRAGAHLVNDVGGVRDSIGTAAAAAEYGAPLVVMHARGRPGAFSHESGNGHGHGDVVDEVAASLRRSVRGAEEAGVSDVVLDPGFGFGKTPEENLRLIARVDRLRAMGRVVLVGVSRKSTIGHVLGTPDAPSAIGERLFGGLGLAALAVLRGASIVRTHDVRPTVDMLALIAAAEAAGADPLAEARA